MQRKLNPLTYWLRVLVLLLNFHMLRSHIYSSGYVLDEFLQMDDKAYVLKLRALAEFVFTA